MKYPLLLRISVLFGVLNLFFLVILLSEMILYFITHPWDVIDMLQEDPIIVVIMTVGYFILIWSLIVNVGLLFNKIKLVKQVICSYILLMSLLFILIISMIILGGEWTLIILLIFFIFLYVQLIVMKYHKLSNEYLEL
ncbi:MAG: hypothetical protein OEY49_19630 [Candidatus Heimdallarchaeota archaeon]|nr:hypothetical protein [Candidatus Heimdallarchaeota archaeon]